MYRLKRLNVVKETNSAVTRDRLIEQGFSLVPSAEETPAAVEEETDDEDDDKPLEKMTISELKECAEKNHINISGLKTKADILAAIQAAASEASHEDGQDIVVDDQEGAADDND